MPKKVLIFTKKVLPMSNTFVAAQSLNLPSFEPVFMGFSQDDSGLKLIEDKEKCLLSDFANFPKSSKFLMDLTGQVSSSWGKALLNYNADIVHAHFGKGGYYCVLISKKLNIPLITTFHGSDITQNDRFSYGQKHRRLVFKNSAKILAVSNFIKNKLIQRGCPENKIIQHYTGIDNEFFSSTMSKSEEPSILFVGRLIEQKGCHLLLQAMKLVQQKIPEAKLIIVGYGHYKNKLEAMASAMKNIYFCGAKNKDDVKTLMDEAWVTCLPSIVMERGNEEGLSSVCIESQAMGTPIVAFDTGGVSEVVAHEKTGLLVVQKDISLLAKSLLVVLSDSGLRERLGYEGVKRVEFLFNIKKQCEKLEKIYGKLI